MVRQLGHDQELRRRGILSPLLESHSSQRSLQCQHLLLIERGLGGLWKLHVDGCLRGTKQCSSEPPKRFGLYTLVLSCSLQSSTKQLQSTVSIKRSNPTGFASTFTFQSTASSPRRKRHRRRPTLSASVETNSAVPFLVVARVASSACWKVQFLRGCSAKDFTGKALDLLYISVFARFGWQDVEEVLV